MNGKLLTVIRQMYNIAKSCIKKDNMISEYFLCNIGARQGDTLSPLLLAVLLYVDDTIILAENEKELQLALDKVHQ